MRVLMSPPSYYGVYYEINPWMHREVPVEAALAVQQWETLGALYRRLGLTVELVDPVPGLPDLVFTANAGLVDRDLFIMSNFRHPERRGEEPYYEAWFRAHGYRIERLPHEYPFEGMGDVKYYRDLLFAGFFFRSDVRTHLMIGERLDKLVVSLELADPRFYHLDTCFAPLGPDLVMYFPGAFKDYSREAIRLHTARQLEVGEEDALDFVCNCMVFGRDLILHRASAALREQLTAEGFTVHEAPTSEFMKAGGSVGCLTLPLDS